MSSGLIHNPIKVSISQFCGIEINDFAVTVAATALWIAESQMMKQTEEIIHMDLDYLPIKSYSNIVEGNALEIDWNSIVRVDKLTYIMGNPPFVGARIMSSIQKDEVLRVFSKIKGAGNLDYVSAWYKKAADFIIKSNIRCAFVSTNSITQGEQVPILWEPIMEQGIKIDFAYRTFKWNSETKEQAAVHCVIVGFSSIRMKLAKYIFQSNRIVQKAKNINAYLIDGPDVFIESRSLPICDTPEIVFGSMPNDGGFLSGYTESTKNDIVKKYPLSESLFRKIMGAHELINNKSRWCLWLKDASPDLIKSIPPIYEAVKNVQVHRSESKREATKKLADTPTLFGEIRQPETDYLIIPRVSSENRRYVPIDFMEPEIIASDACLVVPNATLFHFGVLTSNVHMAWMRTVAGRLKSDYRYSGNLVYNNFPWITPSEEHVKKIEECGKAILNARALYPSSSFADLYDETLMPTELRKAHQVNDRAVMLAYGFLKKNGNKGFTWLTESETVSELMKMYLEVIQ